MTREGVAFSYDDYQVDTSANRISCAYSLGQRHFVEHFTFGSESDWEQPAVEPVARLLFLLAGVSYYKTSAPLVVDLGSTEVTPDELQLLYNFYKKGLGELAYTNGIDLSGLRIEGPVVANRHRALFDPVASTPLVPFGGGIDSIVTAEAIKATHNKGSLFVMSLAGDRFEAIERAASITELPVVRADRLLDPQVLSPKEHGFLRGHVPVTGIISAAGAVAAVLSGHDAVVMSNEWSASAGNLEVNGESVNHQYSKSAEFETEFRKALAGGIDGPLSYFSFLRPHSELWVAERFSHMSQYHRAFHSCNRAFRIDPNRRLDSWCGECDKCCFIDLILAPFLSAKELKVIFDGDEPLERLDLAPNFRALIATAADPKPFECVGDVEECRAALLLAANRPDRYQNKLIKQLAKELPEQRKDDVLRLLDPMGEHCVPDEYATEDLLV